MSDTQRMISIPEDIAILAFNALQFAEHDAAINAMKAEVETIKRGYRSLAERQRKAAKYIQDELGDDS